MNIENRGCKRIALLITGIYQKQKKGSDLKLVPKHQSNQHGESGS